MKNIEVVELSLQPSHRTWLFDKVHVTIRGATPFPQYGEQLPVLTIDCPGGQGKQWCIDTFGIEPTIID